MRIQFSAGQTTDEWEESLDFLANVFLEKKIQAFLEALKDRGIEVAQANCGQYGTNISFSKTDIEGHTLTVVASDTPISRTWLYKGGYKTVEISPLLMAEFGSGNFAIEDELGFAPVEVGRGTFPDQKHANEPEWWWVEDYGQPKQKSSGESPTRPMYTSYMTLVQEIQSIAQSIF